MKKITFFTLAVLAMPLPIQAAIARDATTPKAETAATQEKVFNAQSFMLDNGMQVVVVENNRVPVITHMVWYRAGAADEPRGKSGIAHFLEHLMFKGQEHEKLGSLEPGEFSRIVRSLGGQDNAFTSQDFTAYYQTIASEHLERVMTMEAGRMRGINVPEKDFEAEKLVIQEERRQRTDNNPRAQMNEQIRDVLFTNHPYAIPVIGWMHEVFDLKWTDARAFYDTYYAPNNAILIVSGDVKAQDVLEIAKRTYGLMKPTEIPERKRTTSPPFIAQTKVTLHHDTIKEPGFMRIYRAPSFRQDKKASLALQVLEDILGGGPTSRLYKSLVVDQKIATNASFSYSGTSWDDGTIGITATPAPGHSLDEVEEAIEEQLRVLIRDGITDEELKDSITRMQAEAIFARDSISGPAMIIGYSLVTGSTLDDIETWPSQIEAITKRDINLVTQKYINPDEPFHLPPVTGILLPAEQQAAEHNEKVK